MTEPRLGCYLYCVMRAGGYPSLEGLQGVDAAYGLQPITHGDLVAVVSQVRLDDFGADALKRNLEDLGWIERTARAHDAVLARALTGDAVVPLRICTIFEDELRVREMLERERAYLLDALDRLNRRDEWSVKVLADLEKVQATMRERSSASAKVSSVSETADAPGRAFFARKKRDRAASEDASAVAHTAAEHVHIHLRQHAAAATSLPPQDRRLSQRSGTMMLNGAYLVDRSQADKFAAVVEELRQRECPIGVELELSGPFAAYNFVTPQEEPQ